MKIYIEPADKQTKKIAYTRGNQVHVLELLIHLQIIKEKVKKKKKIIILQGLQPFFCNIKTENRKPNI